MMRPLPAAAAVLALTAVLSAAPLPAQSPRTPAPTSVTFKPGTTGTTLSGTLTGDELKTWMLSARQGQRVHAALKSVQASWLVLRLYPETTPEGSDVFNNVVTSDISMSATLPADDTYVLQLGLRRPEARRGGRAAFEIDLSIKWRAAPVSLNDPTAAILDGRVERGPITTSRPPILLPVRGAAARA